MIQINIEMPDACIDCPCLHKDTFGMHRFNCRAADIWLYDDKDLEERRNLVFEQRHAKCPIREVER